MKAIVAIFLFLPFTGFAQNDTLSPIDRFLQSATGSIVKSEYVDLGASKSVAVRLTKLTNQKSNQSLYYTQLASSGLVDVLNQDLTELVEVLSKLQTISQQPPTERHEKYVYFLKNKIGLHMHENTGLSSGWVVDIGETYYYSNNFKTGRSITIRSTALAELIDGLKKAQTMTY